MIHPFDELQPTWYFQSSSCNSVRYVLRLPDGSRILQLAVTIGAADIHCQGSLSIMYMGATSECSYSCNVEVAMIKQSTGDTVQ
mmetsp:Transcript_9737/g.22886  ORF Transcript_9737/g.22886 Transcript_9737/m.22886 type:complete len:84 (+) Transcript_9737:117-368(+)